MSARPSWFRALYTLWRKELLVAFVSPAAWVFVSGFLLLAGGFFTVAIAGNGAASLRGVLPNWTVLLVLGAPLLTMGAFPQERRDGTMALLNTVPVSTPVLLVGKWLAAWTVLGTLVVLTLPLTAVLWLYGTPDVGVLMTTYLGLFLCSGLFTSMGVLASSLTRDTTVAAVLTLVGLVPLWVAGAAASLGVVGQSSGLVAISLGHHLHSFSVGVLDSGDIAWFVAGMMGCIGLAWRVLEAQRWA